MVLRPDGISSMAFPDKSRDSARVITRRMSSITINWKIIDERRWQDSPATIFLTWLVLVPKFDIRPKVDGSTLNVLLLKSKLSSCANRERPTS
jgi:hypothetical protein